jgi:hypothetical protein
VVQAQEERLNLHGRPSSLEPGESVKEGGVRISPRAVERVIDIAVALAALASFVGIVWLMMRAGRPA